MEKSFLHELESLMTGFWLTDLSNFSAFVFHSMTDLNWVGFYLSDGHVLRLGPFSGKPACTEIAFHRGVCGEAFSKNKMMVVDDVHQFPGHISCDPVSRSELVIPFCINESVIGVLDLDSPRLARFTIQEAEILEMALNILGSRNPRLRTKLVD